MREHEWPRLATAVQCGVAALTISLWLTPSRAPAQEFFRVAPGPLSQGHAPHDKSDECKLCHELGGGVTNNLCLACHHHDDLRKAIAEKRGLHAGFTKPCKTCHTEHKGRQANIVDWGPLGGREGFDHAKTGFSLKGEHAKVACTQCHLKRLSTGRSSYTGLKPDCLSCHKAVHAFTDPELTAGCPKCHQVGVIRKTMPANELPFDHAKLTGVALTGKHGTINCVACHKDARMAMQRPPRSCASCHKSQHGPSWAERPCAGCHDPTRPFKQGGFDHDKTKFALTGKHETAKCKSCHTPARAKMPLTCNGCHNDPHKGRFEKRDCLACHKTGGAEVMAFDHAKTKMPITGAHAKATCRGCHRGKGPEQFEKHASIACRDCHKHKNAHNGQFAGKECTTCHSEGGEHATKFDHNLASRFPLTGLHAELPKPQSCVKCHPNGAYRNNKLHCADCHKDSHKGDLGTSCEKCHTTAVKFPKTLFDHKDKAPFVTEGKHAETKCEKCHPEKKYKTGKQRCYDCHQKDDRHLGKLGQACDRCHRSVRGAPKFSHESMTRMPLRGVHATTACGFCHRVPEGLPPPPGWTAGLPKPPTDLRFPIAGKTCADCHQDHHKGRYGTACESCHQPTSFKNVSATVHDRGFFRLDGAHDRQPCARCHRPGVVLAGTGDLCLGCHSLDDRHANGLGPACGECHGQEAWRPVHFNHAQVGFALRGAHRVARCEGCHDAGTFQGVPDRCGACHATQAAAVASPIHTGELSECVTCHNEVSFRAAKRWHPTWPLRGRHALATCVACHRGGVYAGTPTDCSECHLVDYASTRSPSHLAAGYSTSCADCHTPSGWFDARSTP